MNDLSTQTTNEGPATVVILADNAAAGELAQRCQAAGMTARPVEQAYAAACELLAVDRAVLVIDFDNPQFLQSGLLALAARRSAPVLRIKAAEPLVAELALLLKVEAPAEEVVEEPPADAAPAPVEPAETPAEPQIDKPASAPVDEEPDLGDLLTEEEIAALLRRHP